MSLLSGAREKTILLRIAKANSYKVLEHEQRLSRVGGKLRHIACNIASIPSE